ncbi:tripartite tricarboxylate transporter substrate binding protein [Ramlibacter monticola]|uniref:Tripartite tricarboxylate transporter substrate binding protein n=1 Tax=Ramlibacter monticola TaxID=1926872 RepID=A0A936Z015_9BURK|nr:tripartite tricarboxylate transporter substrate binding protein [Ramlibacter monticola]MBL0392409.1 tripartite tricarboxylate transporter substrate binding protein [Ramlibacter monticola]
MRHIALLRAAMAMPAAVLALAVPPGLADEPFPQKPVTLIVSYPPGGSVDMTARILQGPLAKELGQSVVVENKGGAGGSIATAFVAKAKPDGYTLLMTLSSHTINPWLYDKLPFDTRKDFAAVSLVASTPQVLVAHPSFPAASLAELMASKGTAALPYGSAGVGSPAHVAGELFRMRTGLPFTHVPYRGGGPATVAVLGNEIPLLWVSLPSITQQVKLGKLKALAVSTTERSPALPEIPAVSESLPGFRVDAWNAIFAPAGTPPQVLRRLEQAVMAVTRQPEVKKVLLEQGAVAVGSTAAELDRIVASEIEQWQGVTRAAGMKAE